MHISFSAAEQVSINIQAKDITVQEAVRGAQLLIRYLSSMRNIAKFDSFYSEVIRESVDLTAEPTLPRQRKGPEGLTMVQVPTHMKCQKTDTATCILKQLN